MNLTVKFSPSLTLYFPIGDVAPPPSLVIFTYQVLTGVGGFSGSTSALVLGP